MNIGDRINWNYQPKGGYATSQVVAGIIRKIGPKRVQIEVRIREPYGQRRWMPETRSVNPESIFPRITPCAALGEPMEVWHRGFHVTAWKHPIGTAHSQFQEGIWYAQIDGYQVGAPMHSEERAIEAGVQSLQNGGYRVALRSAIDVFEKWLATPDIDPTHADTANRELPQLRERLAKESMLRTSPGQYEVLILRGNPDRGPETGPGFGRKVRAQFLNDFDSRQIGVKCRLLEDDPHGIGKPDKAGEEGWWEISQIQWFPTEKASI